MSCGKGEKQIRWAFNLTKWRPSLDDLLMATACIQKEEKERIAKFVFRNDFDASLIGRLLMRKFVSEATHSEYDTIIFDRDSNGKPYIKTKDSNSVVVDFNVSHHGSYSVLAGCVQDNIDGKNVESDKNYSCNKSRIGVDVMKIEYSGGKTLEEFFRIMTRNFSLLEWMSIKRHRDDSDRLSAFMRHWCLKESYVKSIGVGITINLQRVSFTVRNELKLDHIVTNSVLDVNGDRQENWKFEESLLDEEHIVAVALENLNTTSPTPFKFLTFEQLLLNAKPLLPKDETYCKNILAKEYKN